MEVREAVALYIQPYRLQSAQVGVRSAQVRVRSAVRYSCHLSRHRAGDRIARAQWQDSQDVQGRKVMLDSAFQAAQKLCLSRALRNENPKLLMAASAICLPFQPMMVSVVHTGMMEVAFAKRALEDPQLRSAHNVHKLSSLLGGVLFVADDAYPNTPYIHAAWHLAAAAFATSLLGGVLSSLQCLL